MAGLIVTCLDWFDFGESYAKACVTNAQTLAHHLEENGVDVYRRTLGKGNPYTHSHLICLRSRKNGGEKDSFLLEEANILTSDINLPDQEQSGVRIGVQEITRRGFTETDMKILSDFIADVLVRSKDRSQVRRSVIEWRKSFSGLHYVNKF